MRIVLTFEEAAPGIAEPEERVPTRVLFVTGGGAFEELREGALVACEPVVGETVLRAENVRRIA